MNYIECPNCGKQISSKSNSCIYCGVSRNIIDQEIKSKELKKSKEITSSVEGFFHNQKNTIIFFEVLILVVISIIYISSYLPRIIEYSHIERVKNNIERCEQYNGIWNDATSTCETEVGNIPM